MIEYQKVDNKDDLPGTGCWVGDAAAIYPRCRFLIFAIPDGFIITVRNDYLPDGHCYQPTKQSVSLRITINPLRPCCGGYNTIRVSNCSLKQLKKLMSRAPSIKETKWYDD